MGDIESIRIDVAVVLDVARRHDAVADLVSGLVRTHLDRLTFDGAVAGVDYAARGDALRCAIDDVVDQVLGWARALREISSALAVSARRYVEVDAHGADRLG